MVYTGMPSTIMQLKVVATHDIQIGDTIYIVRIKPKPHAMQDAREVLYTTTVMPC